MNKEDLMNQIAKIQGTREATQSPLQQKMLRDLRYYQSQLRLSNVELPFSISLAELEPQYANSLVGIHGHTRQEYCLHWEKQGGHFSFTLENVKAKKKKILTECPETILKDIIALIPPMIETMAKQAEQLLKDAVASGTIEVEEDQGNDDELEEFEE